MHTDRCFMLWTIESSRVESRCRWYFSGRSYAVRKFCALDSRSLCVCMRVARLCRLFSFSAYSVCSFVRSFVCSFLLVALNTYALARTPSTFTVWYSKFYFHLKCVCVLRKSGVEFSSSFYRLRRLMDVNVKSMITLLLLRLFAVSLSLSLIRALFLLVSFTSSTCYSRSLMVWRRLLVCVCVLLPMFHTFQF